MGMWSVWVVCRLSRAEPFVNETPLSKEIVGLLDIGRSVYGKHVDWQRGQGKSQG